MAAAGARQQSLNHVTIRLNATHDIRHQLVGPR